MTSPGAKCVTLGVLSTGCCGIPTLHWKRKKCSPTRFWKSGAGWSQSAAPFSLLPRRTEVEIPRPLNLGHAPRFPIFTSLEWYRGEISLDLHEETRIIPRLVRSEEHTSELQSQFHLVCRLLL